MLKDIYCKSLGELVHYIGQPQPDCLYIFIPPNFKLASSINKIKAVFEKQRNCMVYGDIEIHKNGKIIPQLYPSYNLDMNLAIHSPIYINTDKPISADPNKSLEETFAVILKQIYGYHICEILFELHQ